MLAFVTDPWPQVLYKSGGSHGGLTSADVSFGFGETKTKLMHQVLRK